MPTASKKNIAKGAGKSKRAKPAAKAAAKPPTKSSAPIPAANSAAKSAAKASAKKRSYSRDGKWRLLGALSGGELRRNQIGVKGKLSETTLHNNLTGALKSALVEKIEQTGTYRLTPKGRAEYLAHVQSNGAAIPQATASAAKSPAGKAAKRVASPPSTALSTELSEALKQMTMPHSIERLPEKVGLLTEMAPRMPTPIGTILLEIAADLRRIG